MVSLEKGGSLEKIIPEVSRLSFKKIAKQAKEKGGNYTLPKESSYAVTFNYEDPLDERTRFVPVGVVTLAEPMDVRTTGITGEGGTRRGAYDICFSPSSPEDSHRGEFMGLYKRYRLDPQQVTSVLLDAHLDKLPTSAKKVNVLFPK